MDYYSRYVHDIGSVLERLKVTDSGATELDAQKGFDIWCEQTDELRRNNNTMFFAGNGASAAMSSHMSADASKNGGFRSLAFNDIALLTAVSNDISYAESFSLPLKRFADKGDILVTISSSGNSPNIIKALETARELGVATITLSGLGADNQSRKLGDLNFYIPAPTYGLVEAGHQVLLHCWLDLYMEKHKDKRDDND